MKASINELANAPSFEGILMPDIKKLGNSFSSQDFELDFICAHLAVCSHLSEYETIRDFLAHKHSLNYQISSVVIMETERSRTTKYDVRSHEHEHLNFELLLFEFPRFKVIRHKKTYQDAR